MRSNFIKSAQRGEHIPLNRKGKRVLARVENEVEAWGGGHKQEARQGLQGVGVVAAQPSRRVRIPSSEFEDALKTFEVNLPGVEHRRDFTSLSVIEHDAVCMLQDQRIRLAYLQNAEEEGGADGEQLTQVNFHVRAGLDTLRVAEARWSSVWLVLGRLGDQGA